MFGHRALRLLFLLKLRGGLRMQVRKLKRPTSWIFLLVGAVLMFGWVGAFLFGPNRASLAPDPELLRVGVQAGLMVLTLLTVFGSFQHRGLYLPKEEIELAFSAPVDRSALVRYRIGTNLARSLFAALLFGVLASRRLPGPQYAFLGTAVVMLTVPVIGQALALLLGESENRLGKLAAKLPLRVVSVVLAMGVAAIVAYLLIGNGDDLPSIEGRGPLEPVPAPEDLLQSFARHPVVHALLLPFAPWGRMITAGSAAEFLPWFAFSVGAWMLIYQLTVRIRIDYRELSLATSADLAKRLRMARRGGWSASQGRAAAPRGSRGAPWLFGSGGFGAVAWLETTSMLRRARGTLILSLLVITLLVILSGSIGGRGGSDPESALEKNLIVGSALISLLGTLYMCAGLRFDFRGRLEQMERIKAWPLAAWRTFLATILPEVALVSALISLAVIGRAAWIGAWHPFVLGIVLFQPLVVLTWVALDNAVFLFAPVRYIPGQESALQHMGRSVMLMLLRGLILLAVAAVAVGPAVGLGFLLRGLFDVPDAAAIAAAVGVAWLGVLAVDAALVWIGGRMLARFDVARDTGV